MKTVADWERSVTTPREDLRRTALDAVLEGLSAERFGRRMDVPEKPDGEAPWANREVRVPTDRDYVSVVAPVECALDEVTHEAVGTVLVSR